MYRLITKEEEEIMRDLIRKNANISCYSSEYTGELKWHLKDLLRYWSFEKENMFQMLGQKLIHSRDIEIEASESELMELVYQKGLNYDHPFSRDVKNFFATHFDYSIRANINQLFYADTLASNIYTGESYTIVFGNDSYKMNKGCKVSKALQKINNLFVHSKYYEDFRLQHSMVRNVKRIKGTMCLSIHPLDFMTASDNNYKWDSCLSWSAHGDYRQGTITMMNSPCVVIAYIKGEGNYCGWNNKKWRQFYIVDEKYITCLIQYPYENDYLSKMCLAELRSLAEQNLGWGPYTQEPQDIKAGTNNHIEELDTDITLALRFCYMYNDFYGTGHFTYFSTGLKSETPIIIDTSPEGVDQCMICGKASCIDYSGELACEKCIPCCYCENCGDKESIDNSYEVDDEYYCQSCYEDLSYCCWTEEKHTNDNLVALKVRYQGIFAPCEFPIYEKLLKDSDFIAEVGEIMKDSLPKKYYVDFENLSDEAKNIFGLDEKDFNI